MKLHTVLTAVDDNPLYHDFVPVFQRAWKRLFPEINIVIIRIVSGAETAAAEGVVCFEALADVHPAFQSQCIRLLWPALVGRHAGLAEDDAVLITDIDMLPMSRGYYSDTIRAIESGKFVCMRNIIAQLNQYPICYNVATPRTWAELFGVSNEADVRNRLGDWYRQVEYDGLHGGKGWSFDQAKLFQTANRWELQQRNSGGSRLVLMNDRQTGFRRLDRSQADAIRIYLPRVLDMVRQRQFTDFHLLRPYSEHREIIETILSALQA